VKRPRYRNEVMDGAGVTNPLSNHHLKNKFNGSALSEHMREELAQSSDKCHYVPGSVRNPWIPCGYTERGEGYYRVLEFLRRVEDVVEDNLPETIWDACPDGYFWVEDKIIDDRCGDAYCSNKCHRWMLKELPKDQTLQR